MAKKSRPRDDEEDLEGDAPISPKADAYVGLSAITLVLLIAAGVLFYLDSDALDGAKTTGPSFQVTAAVPTPVATK
jgi:hypothetical protein